MRLRFCGVQKSQCELLKNVFFGDRSKIFRKVVGRTNL